MLREILRRMKDDDSPGARAEAYLLAALKEGGMDAQAVDVHLDSDVENRFGAPVSPAGIRKEALRGGLAQEEDELLRITPLGEWYLEQKK